MTHSSVDQSKLKEVNLSSFIWIHFESSAGFSCETWFGTLRFIILCCTLAVYIIQPIASETLEWEETLRKIGDKLLQSKWLVSRGPCLLLAVMTCWVWYTQTISEPGYSEMTERVSCAQLNLGSIKNGSHIKYIILCLRAVWLVWEHVR